MALKATFKKHVLKFKFDAGTSRGILREKNTWFIKIWDTSNPTIFGLGEAGPLVKLSIDDRDDFEDLLDEITNRISELEIPENESQLFALVNKLVPSHLPSIKFGVETALFDLLNGGERKIFSNNFVDGKGIPINGLVWMGDMEDMLLQITDKIDKGYKCIKIKIGSLNFEKECDILQYVRNKYYRQEIILRVDANGAFSPDEAMEKLEELSKFKIHSIEQPIKAGQVDLMKDLCEKSPVPIALDEELIGVHGYENKKKLLQKIRPQYIILKPTLLGGIQSCNEWIEIATSLKIGWWITSALESNIGLNAICQYTAQHQISMHQGLGTGQLYENNIDSPLQIDEGYIHYRTGNLWDMNHAV